MLYSRAYNESIMNNDSLCKSFVKALGLGIIAIWRGTVLIKKRFPLFNFPDS